MDESAQGIILKAFESAMGRFILKKCKLYLGTNDPRLTSFM